VNVALRPYQVTGRDFLLDRRFAILGDAMGLGKSPQSICAAAELLRRDPYARVLIAAPAATLPGLAREVATWAPGLPVAVLDAKGKVTAPVAGFVLVAWTSIAKRADELLAGPRFVAFIADEAHRVKNPAAKVTKHALGAWAKVDGAWTRSASIAGHADRVWALTGTPIPNRPIELQPLLQMAGGLRWAAKAAFGDRYCRRTNRWAPRGFDYLGANNLGELGARLRSEGILLRRLPEDVPGELPTLTTSIVPLAGCDDKAILATAGLDPDAIRSAVGEGSTLDFEELAAYRAAMGERKAPAAAAWVADWLDDNGDDAALVVFVWHKAVAARIAADLGNDEEGNPIAFVATGDDSPEERQRMVDAFAAGSRRVFVGSIAACGTGLNGLHKRTTFCAFAEVAWTPGELTQAIGRVRRFGSVGEHAHAWILVGEESLEDHVLQTIAAKLDTSAAVLGDTVAKGSTASVAVEPSAAIAAAKDYDADYEEVEAVELDPIPEPTARAWNWTKLRGSDAWGVRADHIGSDAWEGAEVTVYNRAGKASLVALGRRVAGGDGWSVYELATLAPPKRDREYFRRRIAARNVTGTEDARPLTAEERADAVILHAAAARLTAANPDACTQRNDVGWSSADAKVGSVLAVIPVDCWDAGTLTAARAVVRRYTRTQAPEARAAATRGAA
jgi:SWI/SNF-related matrix-associated actin-dependent regulator 1 of chromatin subfamily A